MKTSTLKKQLVNSAKKAFERNVIACKKQSKIGIVTSRRVYKTTGKSSRKPTLKEKRIYVNKCLRQNVMRLVNRLA